MAFQEEEKLTFCECNQGHSKQLIYAKTYWKSGFKLLIVHLMCSEGLTGKLLIRKIFKVRMTIFWTTSVTDLSLIYIKKRESNLTQNFTGTQRFYFKTMQF